MSLADALERAAEALPELADDIRPANGDPARLLETLAPDAGARVLTWLLTHEPEAGAELAAAWAELDKGEAPLARVDEAALPREGRKALRRALHRLRARGVDVRRPAPAPRVATAPPVADTLPTARLSPLDGSGAQLLVIAEAAPGGGVRVFEAVMDDERGVLEFHALSTTRSGARQLLRDLARRERFAPVEVPVESARARLAQVAAAHPGDRPLPRAFAEWRSRAAAAPEGAQTPGALARAEGGEPGADDLDRALALIESGELGPWPPTGERLREFADRVMKASRSELVLPDRERRERIDAVLAELLEARFDEAAREATARRFEESAFVLARRGRAEDARAALAAARELRSTAPGASRVARALLERALRPALEAARSEAPGDEAPDSLVVKP